VRFLLASAVLVLASCGASPTPRVTPELLAAAQADDGAVGAGDLEHGREIYIGRCAACHALPRPADYDPPTWRKWMRSMAPKAKLDNGQEHDALRYVLAVRAAGGR
jgi:mono/diheme cytochrome c family protein